MVPAEAGHEALVFVDGKGGTTADLGGEVKAGPGGGDVVGGEDDASAAIDVEGPFFASYPVRSHQKGQRRAYRIVAGLVKSQAV